MDVKGDLLQEFKVRQPQLTVPSSSKRDSLLVFGMSTRENFPAQYFRWKNLDVNSNNDQSIRHLSLSKNENPRLPDLSFDRMQLTDEECVGLQKRNFGCFIVRQAILDEEYWAAAWLRAEAYWESFSYLRDIDRHKLKFTEEEFYALKRRCSRQEGNSLKCFCFVAMKKDDKNVRRSVLNSIVGTLDLSIRQFVHGETHPEEAKRRSAVLASQEPIDTHQYAYIANVCVAKFARCQGVASNMLYLAADVAIMIGIRQIFVHVNADNKPAQELYRKVGFQVVDTAPSQGANKQRMLMSMEL